ncbi:LytR family transcriptional attenuator [Murinocardiopsis flavida]|uniref:LytR family transcriptional attenuator n=1 Tax=Murinocardiopsis flavida TaxID=645275 RepID=A0A2P8DSI8_9ACTN|nr:LCP family protein [Murinocardiopsis flavida]PSL00184.1 LytR family transcriptional attenuator [Murinocardiopsis flavida]
MAEQEDEGRNSSAAKRPMGTMRALLWTTGSVFIPGIAHLRTGRKAAGAVILGAYLLLVAAAVVAAVLVSGDLASGARLGLQSRWLLTAAGVAFVVAVLWMTVIVHSWSITRPPGRRWGVRVLSSSLVLVLCLAIAAPAGAVMYASYTFYDAMTTVFGNEPGDVPHNAADPWNGQDRVNVLLLGGDSGDNRYGTRTDSMMVASIDVKYGDVVLIGLPRNLESVQFPKGSALAERYPPPAGFTDLLNEVYQAVADDPKKLAIDPDASDPAADTLKQVISDSIGQEIDYYTLVDMYGFAKMIDAVGGIDVHVDEPIPYGLEGKVIESGDQHLTGDEAMWYGRSRTNSDDYSRMGRQGCLIKYVAEQADPATLLTSFQDLAGATKRTFRTDIPQSKVPHFVDLAQQVSEGNMKTFQLSPPQVNTANPDWKKIRTLVDDAVQEQEDAQGSDAGPDDQEPSPSASPKDETAEPGGGEPSASPTTPGRQVGDEATSLEKLCP